MKSRTLLSFIFLTLTLSTQSILAADQEGDTGFIKSIKLVSTHSDDYPLYHGSIVLDTDGVETEYHWGGSFCPGRNLIVEPDNFLVKALKNYAESSHILITPQYNNGQGGARCLLAFTATAQSRDCCGCLKDKIKDKITNGLRFR